MDLEIILKNALELIAQGTVDVSYPLRCAPREALMEHAQDALTRYEDAVLTKKSSGQETPNPLLVRYKTSKLPRRESKVIIAAD